MLLIYCMEVNELRCIRFRQFNNYIQHAVTYIALSNGQNKRNGQYLIGAPRGIAGKSSN